MRTEPVRRSPVHDFLASRGAKWRRVGDALVPERIAGVDEERAALSVLALADLSYLTKLAIRGPGAEAWLRARNLSVPVAVYDTAPLPDGGILARTGTDQFLLESGHANQAVPALATQLGCDEPGVYRVERQDATFLLTGARALDVLAQVCGIDVRHAAPRRLILTRLAGVNGGLLPETRGDLPAFRLWVEPSQAPGLWESLATIVDALGGRIVGTACLM